MSDKNGKIYIYFLNRVRLEVCVIMMYASIKFTPTTAAISVQKSLWPATYTVDLIYAVVLWWSREWQRIANLSKFSKVVCIGL